MFFIGGIGPGTIQIVCQIFLKKPTREDRQKEWDKFEKEKAKIVSVLARNLYTLFTLSKDQIKNITSFWKAMIVFISPESEATANKIHVSYSGCLREAQKKCAAIQTRHLEMMRDCWFFGLAIDTAQFGPHHFMSCVVRFGFVEEQDLL